MTLQVKCECGEILRIPRPAPGEEWKCPSCGATIQGQQERMETDGAMEIPIEGSAIGPRQAAQASHAGATQAGAGTSATEGLEDELEEPEEAEEFERSGNGIPKGMLWGVFLVLLGLLGMIFLLKPGTRQESAGPGQEGPKADTPVSVAEDISVRVAVEPSAGEGTGVPEAVPSAVGGADARNATAAAGVPQPFPPAGAETPPRPEALPLAEPLTGQEPTAKTAVSPAASARPSGAAALAPPAPTPPAAPAKPVQKLASSKPAAGKPGKAYTLNVGSFKARKNAEALKQDLEQKGIEASVTEVRLADKGTWYRVSVGRFSTPAAARRLAQELERKWQIPSFVAQLD